MLITIIIFFISICVAFGMLSFRAWELRTNRLSMVDSGERIRTDLSFRHIEKNMLYLTKHIVQGLVITIAKYWFITSTKTKKWVLEKWPQINDYFKSKISGPDGIKKTSFLRRAILESQAKIRRVKERVKEEHE